MTRRKKYGGGNLTTHINYGAKLLSYCKSESWTKTNVYVQYTYYIHIIQVGGGDINGLICNLCVTKIKTIVFLDTMCFFSLIFCTYYVHTYVDY